MNILQRITASFTGSIENAVSHLENHEAVVHAALKDTRAMAAKAKVRLARVKQDGDKLNSKLTKLKRMETVWAERAISVPDSDEKKALECVKRRNYCLTEIETTTKAIIEHKNQEQNLRETVASIEARIGEIENAKNLLRTRQTAAEAQRAVVKLESSSSLAVDDVLERWEMSILQTEYDGSIDSKIDELDMEFEEIETTEELKAQLEVLRNSGTDSDKETDEGEGK